MLRRQDDEGSGIDLSNSLFLHLFEKQAIPGTTNNKILSEPDWEKTLRRDAGKTVAQRGYLEDHRGGTSSIPASLNANERLMIKFDVNNTKFKRPPDVLQTALSDGVSAEVLLGCAYRTGSSWTVARMGHVHEATVLELNDADSVFLVGGVLHMHHFLSNRSLFTVAAELTPNPPGCAGVVILSPGVLDLRRALNLKEVQDKLGCSTADTEAVLKDGFVALRHWFEKPNINDANSFKPTRGGMVPLFAAPPGAPANAKQPRNKRAAPQQGVGRRHKKPAQATVVDGSGGGGGGGSGSSSSSSSSRRRRHRSSSDHSSSDAAHASRSRSAPKKPKNTTTADAVASVWDDVHAAPSCPAPAPASGSPAYKHAMDVVAETS
jgi:hypothetical protein